MSQRDFNPTALRQLKAMFTGEPDEVDQMIDDLRKIVFPGQQPEPKWIQFVDVTPQGTMRKTKVFHVYNKDNGAFLGTIAWYGAFRKYSYTPHENTIFESTCLRDIASFLDHLMEERKKEKNDISGSN